MFHFQKSCTQGAEDFRIRDFVRYNIYLLIVAVLLFYATYIDRVSEDWTVVTFSLPDFLGAIVAPKALVTVAVYFFLLNFFIQLRYIGWFVFLPYLLYQAVRMYMYYSLAIKYPESYAAVFMETDWDEASSYLTITNILYVLIFLAVAALMYWGGRHLMYARGIILRVSIWLMGASCLIALVAREYGAGVWAEKTLQPYYSFMVFTYNAMNYMKNGGDELVSLKHLPSSAFGCSECSKVEPRTIVYIVGESVRSDHLQFFGYERATTPKLLQRLQRGELAAFRALSFDTATGRCMPGMFTNATLESRQPTVGSFVSLFNKHGYRTHFLYNMSETATLRLLTRECHEKYFSDSFEVEDILHKLRELCENKGEDRLVIIQTKGSHFHYPNKYPHDRFAVFTPHENYTDFSTDNPDLVNSYDNTILYLDYFLDEVIKIIEDSSSVLVYCSDHGESLGESGRFLHNGPLDALEQRQVPLLIWGSDTYKKNNKEQWETLMSRTNEMAEHGNLFPTLISLGGIKSDVQTPGYDLTLPLPNRPEK